MSELITLDMLVEEKKYRARPGLKYELAKGIIGTMRKDTIDLVNQVESVPVTEDGEENGKPRPLLHIALDRAKLILETPDGWDDWGSTSPKVIWRVVQDFLRLTLPTQVPEN